MRIAIYHNLPSGGAKRSLYETVRRLAQRHTLDFYTLDSADEQFCDVRPFAHSYHVYPSPHPTLLSSPFGRLNQLNRWQNLHRLQRLHQKIAAEIDAKGYDVVLVQPSLWTQAPLLLRFLQTSTVYFCHEPPRHLYDLALVSPQKRGLSAWLDQIDPLIKLYRTTAKRWDWLATRSANLVLVNSAFSQKTIAQVYGIQSEVCYNAVDIDVFRPLPHVQRQAYVLSVGAIQPLKGFDFLIESLGQIPLPKRPFLRLVGNSQVPYHRAFLEQLARDHQVEMSIEVGLSLEQLVQRYNEAALLAYAPYNEPFGLVPLEAMACATPVIGVAEGGVCESVVDGVNGRLIPRDPLQFASAIQEWIINPTLRQHFGAHGRDHILANWTWEASVKTLENYLQSTLEVSTNT